jgi:hypothetical protein
MIAYYDGHLLDTLSRARHETRGGARQSGRVEARGKRGIGKNKKNYERSQYVIENKWGHTEIAGTKLRSNWKQRSYTRIW